MATEGEQLPRSSPFQISRAEHIGKCFDQFLMGECRLMPVG